jgi:hypothetical protein
VTKQAEILGKLGSHPWTMPTPHRLPFLYCYIRFQPWRARFAGPIAHTRRFSLVFAGKRRRSMK